MITLANLAPAFSFVASKGLVPTTSIFTPQEFGNATVVMAGNPCSLRFQRDRGQVTVDIGSEDLGWHKLEYALEFVDRAITQDSLGEPPDIDRMAMLLQLRWQDVVGPFSDRVWISELQAFAEQRSAALLKKIFN